MAFEKGRELLCPRQGVTPIFAIFSPCERGLDARKMRTRHMRLGILPTAFFRIGQIMPTVKNHPVRIVKMSRQNCRITEHGSINVPRARSAARANRPARNRPHGHPPLGPKHSVIPFPRRRSIFRRKIRLRSLERHFLNPNIAITDIMTFTL